MNYTGVGVDLRVDNAVIFGLPDTAENLLQEGGRPMRGSPLETQGKHGFSFFFHKGNLGKIKTLLGGSSLKDDISEAKHCPPSSDVRALIAKPLPRCQTKTILDLFEDNVQVEMDQCSCCFACIKRHSESGCEKCCEFLAKFVMHKSQGRVQNSPRINIFYCIF